MMPLACGLLAVLLGGDVGAEPPPPLRAIATRRDEAFEREFLLDEGWIGGDAVYSIPLPDESLLWVFGDTLVGTVRDGRRHDVRMVNNSVARQPRPGAGGGLELILGRDPDGTAMSCLVPRGKPGYFWPWDGIVEDGRLHLVVTRLTSPGTITAFDWTLLDQSLLVIDNPLDPPARWRVGQIDLPCAEFGPDAEALWGLELLRTDDSILVYGTVRRRAGEPRSLVVARSDPADLAAPDRWTFLAAEGWQADPRRARPLATDVGTEGSITWMPEHERFVYVYSPPLDPRIQMRTARTPLGPWSEPVTIHTCPEPAWNPRVFCYAGKARRMPGSDGELLVSYATNSFDMLSDVTADRRIYLPRFVRVTLGENP